MALSVSTSWIRFVKRPFDLTFLITMSTIARLMSKQLFAFLKVKGCLSQLTSTLIELRLGQLCLISTDKKVSFVGVETEHNCNEKNGYDIVTKKNTRISCPSVLAALCTMCKQHWVLVNSNVAQRKIKINFFAGRYV